MKEELAVKVSEVIDVISAKLGVGVEYFWPIFVRQQSLRAIIAIVGFVFSCVLLSCSAYLFYWADKKGREGIVFISIVFGVISLIAFCGLGVEAIMSFPRILNPEYYALQSIMGMVIR